VFTSLPFIAVFRFWLSQMSYTSVGELRAAVRPAILGGRFGMRGPAITAHVYWRPI
jgi:hypothetical protein